MASMRSDTGERDKVLDPGILWRRLDRDDRFLALVLDQFHSDLLEWDRRLQFLHEQADVAGLRRLAHEIKGAAANVCAAPLRDAAQALECDLRAGNALPCHDRLQACRVELRQALAVVVGLLVNHPGAVSDLTEGRPSAGSSESRWR